MMRGPKTGLKTQVDFIAKARAAWGNDLPHEIEALARACMLSTATQVARDLGYSSAVISHVLAKKYPGDVNAVFAKIRGRFIGEVTSCPILGDIARDQCVAEQKRPFAATNSTRARLYHTCRHCPNNLNATEEK